ncbi:type I-G CRISPR-associated RAMP protein Csb1/Cas7g [Pyrinomonas methylaliphatogenes]|uniref:CRISPR-associated protein, Csx4 family n=1 Tax=Pyrinomonas methylaliphatogenes TaxID=454194 RepID=A0A0B6WYZ7_9BACT|nr:type I-U CRISPR-associated RAMP protein Csb1/Cas7u [Pyrinomonas methylaliphatogenes]CDM65514.1 CRISPR-associated protein, Csx4 family [Pyrinomonas methylaliphatogenes]
MNDLLTKYDEWLNDGSEVAALVLRQWLMPVEGRDAVIFPPTYAKPERVKEEDWLGYNIDRFSDGTSVCQIDSVGSQANRIEPIFKRTPYSSLVPQITIRAGGKEINLLDAGQRAADAIVRFSTLADELRSAFKTWQDDGNAEPLAKIAPTSIVFGSWDSRETQAKLPRVFRSVIRAFNVEVLHRSAQYIPPIDYVVENLVDASTDQKRLSELGFSHAPAPWTHGGVIAKGGIRRDATLNLVAIRTLGTGSNGNPLKLRRYIFGLALVGLTAPQDFNLREGCQLVLDQENPSECSLVRFNGSREEFKLSHEDALRYAQEAAKDFGVGQNKTGEFSPELAKKQLAKTKEDRKAGQRKSTATSAEATSDQQQTSGGNNNG